MQLAAAREDASPHGLQNVREVSEEISYHLIAQGVEDPQHFTAPSDEAAIRRAFALLGIAFDERAASFKGAGGMCLRRDADHMQVFPRTRT